MKLIFVVISGILEKNFLSKSIKEGTGTFATKFLSN